MSSQTIDAPVAAPASAPARTTSPKRNPLRLIIPLVLLVGAAYWGYTRWSFSQAHESTDNAQVDGRIVPVVAKAGGYVTHVNVAENGHVKEGDTLVRIDDRELAVRVAQAEADLAAARAAAGGTGAQGQAAAQVQVAASQRDVGTAQTAAARAAVVKAESDLARAKELSGKGIISLAALDAAQASYDAAAANLQATQRSVSAASSGVSNAEAGVRLAQARLQAAQAARENSALQLSFATITAPLSGIVSRKNVEVGQLVQPGQTLFSIVSDTGVFVTANVKETGLARVRVPSTSRRSCSVFPCAFA
jgi:membrane fusion protein (multidrug efflux system)